MEIAKSPNVCKNSAQINQLRDLARFSAQQKMQQCQDNFKANNCDELQRSLSKEDQDKIAKCDAKDLCREFPGKTLDFQIGCFKSYGSFAVDTLKSLWGAGESFVTTMQEQSACYNDLNQKKLMYSLYNNDAPAAMQLRAPPDDVLSRMKCTDIQSQIFSSSHEMSRKLSDQIDLASKLKKPLSSEQQEFADWQKNKNSRRNPGEILEHKVKEYLRKQGLKLQCFNSDAIGQIVCEAEATVVFSFIGGAGLATKGPFIKDILAISKDAKVAEVADTAGAASKATQSAQKVEDFANKAQSAERRGGGGVGQKFISDSQKEEVLNLSGTMTDEERIAAFEKVTGKNLSRREADQLIKMHESSGTKSFDQLTKEDIDEKIAIANEKNPDTGKPYFTKDETDFAIRNGLTGMSKEEQEKFYKKYAAEAANPKNDYSQTHRLHAESANNLGKTEEAATAYKRAYSAYIKEKRIDLSNPTAAKQRLSQMSETELGQIEDLAAYSGNTDKLVDIERAKWKTIENDIRSRFRNQPGAAQMTESTVQAEYQNLQAAARSSNPLTKKAAEEKIKAFKTVYPGLR